MTPENAGGEAFEALEPASPASAEDGEFEAMLDRVADGPSRARPGLGWLDEPDGEAEPGPASAPSPAGEDEAAPSHESRAWPLSLLATALLCGVAAALLGGGYLLFGRPAPAPSSAALDAERNGPALPEPAEPGLPIDPPALEDAAPEGEPTAADDTGTARPEAPTPVQAPATAPADDGVLVPVEPAPPAGPDRSATPPPRTADAPQRPAAADERLVQLVRQLETHQALIERLERGEQLLRDRLAGLELQGQGPAAGETRAGPAPSAAAPKPAKKPQRVPPSTASRPVKTLQRRADSPQASGSPLPFSVESVDTWNGEPTVVLRSGGRLIDVRPGASHQGWRIEAAHGQSVTLRSPNGVERTLEAGREGGP